MRILFILFVSACVYAEPQIQIAARFFDTSTKPESVLSAPRVITLAGQEAMVTVGSEHVLSLPGTDQVQTLDEGISLKIRPSVREGRVLLEGTFRHSDPVAPSSIHRSKELASATLRRTETSFMLWARPGAPQSLTISEDKRLELQVELIAFENAAPIYWQAFAALPPQPENAGPGDLAKWLEESEDALNLLHKAAAMDHCDWELDYSKGFELALPHLGKMNSLCKAAIARAQAFPAQAQADLQAAMRAAGHIGVDPLIMPQLVRLKLQKEVRDVLDPSDLSAAEIKAWQQLLAANGPELAELIDKEREIMLGYVRAKLTTATDQEKAEMLNAIGLELANDTNLTAMLEGADADYRELLRAAGLPQAERGPAIAAFEAKLATKEANALSRQLLPSIGTLNEKFQRAAAENQALAQQLMDDFDRVDREYLEDLFSKPHTGGNFVGSRLSRDSYNTEQKSALTGLLKKEREGLGVAFFRTNANNYGKLLYTWGVGPKLHVKEVVVFRAEEDLFFESIVLAPAGHMDLDTGSGSHESGVQGGNYRPDLHFRYVGEWLMFVSETDCAQFLFPMEWILPPADRSTDTGKEDW